MMIFQTLSELPHWQTRPQTDTPENNSNHQEIFMGARYDQKLRQVYCCAARE